MTIGSLDTIAAQIEEEENLLKLVVSKLNLPNLAVSWQKYAESHDSPSTKAALQAPDRFGMLLGIGIITGLITQALFNMSVVISILPAKGIPLPFISYGGTSVVLTLFAVGILLNISQYSGFVSLEKDQDEKPVRRKRSRTGLK